MNINKRGFTLIELLVVIAIISLLSSIVFSSVSKSESKARDSKRIQAMIQLRNAIESYYTVNGRYTAVLVGGAPTDDFTSIAPGGSHSSNLTDANLDNLIPELIPTYIKSFPSNPADPNNWMFSYYSNKGKDYFLLMFNFLENPLTDNSPFFFKESIYGTAHYILSPFIYSSKDFIKNLGWL
jgi:prepilin-type N-terminal cleavage/methylation domain-containing protein